MNSNCQNKNTSFKKMELEENEPIQNKQINQSLDAKSSQVQRRSKNNLLELDLDSALKDAKTLQNNRWLVSWNSKQDDILFQRYVEFGSRWSDFTDFLPSKTDNSIKNRFYCCMRKVQRKLNQVQKQKKIKHRKLIKYESLLTFLEIGKSDFLSCDRRLSNANKNSDQIIEIRNMIINIAKMPEKEIKDTEVQKLLLEFLQVKYSLKFINIQRVKKSSKTKASEVEAFSTQENTYTEQGNNDYRFGEDHEEKQQHVDEGSSFDMESLDPMVPQHKKHKRKMSLFEECQHIFQIQNIEDSFDHNILP